jgi:hypothetical protein
MLSDIHRGVVLAKSWFSFCCRYEIAYLKQKKRHRELVEGKAWCSHTWRVAENGEIVKPFSSDLARTGYILYMIRRKWKTKGGEALICWVVLNNYQPAR